MSSEAIERAAEALWEATPFHNRERADGRSWAASPCLSCRDQAATVVRALLASAEGRAALIAALNGEQVGVEIDGDLFTTEDIAQQPFATPPGTRIRPVFAFPSEGTAAEVETPQ